LNYVSLFSKECVLKIDTSDGWQISLTKVLGGFEGMFTCKQFENILQDLFIDSLYDMYANLRINHYVLIYISILFYYTNLLDLYEQLIKKKYCVCLSHFF